MRLRIAATLVLMLSAYPVHALDYQVITEEWAPYSYQENGRVAGVVTEVVRAIMALNHVDYPISLVPSMRLTVILDSEPRTIMFSLFRTPEREPKYKWVGPVLEESIYPYRRKAATVPEKTLDELRGVREITTRHAGLIPKLLLSEGFRNLDTRATESEQLYRMLFSGRAAMIIGDTDLGVRFYVKKLGFDDAALERVPVEIFRSELYIVFSPDSEDTVVEAWRRALGVLKETGALEALLAKVAERP